MTTNQTQFFKDLAALMEKHNVSIAAVEKSANYQTWADGIEFIFSDAYEEVRIGKGTCNYFGADILEIVEKMNK